MGGTLRHRASMTRDSPERVLLLTDKKEPCGPVWKCLPLSEVAQVIPPFFMAGFGTLAAGLLLDEVQNWKVFQTIGELFVLVPALLGLKGNLAMTLASRLSTEAHRGIQDPVSVVSGYLALDQAQALIVGLLASMIALVTGLANGTTVTNMIVLIATGLITASLVSIILGGLMCVIVLGSYRYNWNPDNIATPIAASLGDTITLAILACTAYVLFDIPDQALKTGICTFTITVYMIATIPLLRYSWNNIYARPAVLQGWGPILLAMMISSAVGVIMSKVAEKYSGLLGFLPIINGIGGNLAAIQASRLSTSYNLSRAVDFSEAGTSLFLLLLVIPGHVVFLGAKQLLDPSTYNGYFYGSFAVSALIQVSVLLVLCYLLVMLSPHLRNMDPDIYSIPILTALGDFLGTFLLTMSVTTLDNMGLFKGT